MKIIDIRAMRGPNIWSIWRHKLIVMKLDLEEYEEKPTNHIKGFYERMKAMMPGLYDHRCSEGRPGGFYHRVEEGTWLGHVIEHIALEIQTMAGMDTGFGRTRGAGPVGVYNVVFAYFEESVGKFAAEESVKIALAIAEDKPYDLEATVQKMREMRERVRLGPSTGALVEEAAKRGIPYIRLNHRSLVQLGYGINQKRIQATVTSNTCMIGTDLAGDKEMTKKLLDESGIPTPKGEIVYNEQELERALNRIGYPVVLKPIDGNHGRGATTNITNFEDAVQALEAAKVHSRAVIVERYITGLDHRMLVINYQFVAAAKRTPAAVTGDGKSTIQQLIDKVNADPRRGYGHEKELTQIAIDKDTRQILQKRELTLESVLPQGEELYLKTTANLSTGGTSTDVTEFVHPHNIFMAERIARIIGLDICGIDVMTTDLSQHLSETGGAVIEVNAAPGFRMHIAPTEGLPRNVAEPVIDMLYPPGVSARIPILAVTGTNGKTTTTRLLAHIMRTNGSKVGFTTTDGVYIQNRMVQKGDCTGPVSTELVLRDPTIDLAVLEVARGGILRAGLGFHNCNIGIVTNISADHLGLKDINTVEDMAKVKAVVVESVLPEGYSVLNADDDLVYAMREKVDSKIALFSLDENSERIQKHCNRGGIAAVVDNGYVSIRKGNWNLRINRVHNIPLTLDGRASFNIQNILAASLAAYLHGVKIEELKVALETFRPSPTQTPGRMNVFRFRDFTVMADYAHNTAGYRALSQFLQRTDATKKVGVIAGVGDRRDEDLIELGRISAEMFDEIIIRLDENLRGRTPEDMIDKLKTGILDKDPSKPVTVIADEQEAIIYAINNAEKGAFITVCSDVITVALQLIMKLKEEEDQRFIEMQDLAVQS